MSEDIIGETKQNFSVAWSKHLPSRELPCLDFLNNSDQAFEQFRHSIAVINDCLTTIKVEVFIVKFLRTHILSDGKCATDLKPAFNINDVVADLESIFAAKKMPNVEANNTDVANSSLTEQLEENVVKSRHVSAENEGNLDKTSSSDVVIKDSVIHNHTVSCAIEAQNTLKHETETADDLKAHDSPNRSPDESENNVGLSSEQVSQNTELVSPVAHKEAVTIFTPLRADERFENKTDRTKNESSLLPVETSEEKSLELGLRETDNATGNTVNVESTQVDDDIQSSGNELDTYNTDDPFSSDSCSNSPDPVHENLFLQDGAQGEIVTIMPYSSRRSFYSVDPSYESADLGTAEHIYEDIDRYRATVGKEDEGEVKRHLSQSEITLKKTFSVGAIRTKKDSNDDVFTAGSSSEGKVDALSSDYSVCHILATLLVDINSRVRLILWLFVLSGAVYAVSTMKNCMVYINKASSLFITSSRTKLNKVFSPLKLVHAVCCAKVVLI